MGADPLDMPWGWWLRIVGGALEDDAGRRWRNVRQAYWCGELGFPDPPQPSEQQELLLRVLTAIDGRSGHRREMGHDLLQGDILFWRFYQCWLVSTGLLVGDGSPYAAPLSPKGRSVMLMLQATREPAWVELPFADLIDAIRQPDRTEADEGREASLKTFERAVARRTYVFARERTGRSYTVTLTGISVGARMPTRRVMWSHPFSDERARDDFFAWLAQRVDRWDDWGALAYGRGAPALTQRLLTLFLEGGGFPS